MRVLVAGAHGFLGSHIAAALAAAGHEVVGAGRDLVFARRTLPQLDWIACDFNRDTAPANWLPRLAGIDAVVNAVGVLQATRRDRLERIHVDAPIALMKACELAGVRRFVQVSALGIETAATEYARTKRAGDEALAATCLDWVVLRASLVVGRGSYGGTSLMRGLAGLPGVIPLMGGGEFHLFQPILMRDFTRVVVAMLEPGAPSLAIVPIAGPEQITLKDVILSLRQWLGFGPARVLAVPGSLMRMAARIGDALGWVGVPTALRTTSIKQMEAGSYVAESDAPQRLPIDAEPLRNGLFSEPATVEDRWHARLYFLKPLLRVLLGLYWLRAGWTPLRHWYFEADWIAAIRSVGTLRDALIVVVSLIDPLLCVAVGFAFLVRRGVWLFGSIKVLFLLAMIPISAFVQSTLSGHWSVSYEQIALGSIAPLALAAATLVVLAIEGER